MTSETGLTQTERDEISRLRHALSEVVRRWDENDTPDIHKAADRGFFIMMAWAMMVDARTALRHGESE